MAHQLDFLETFEIAERRWKARHDLIDSSPADARVKVLLHMLADFPQSVVDEFGNSHVTLGIMKMASRLGRTKNTVKAWLRQARASPYLEVLNPDCNHDERTYVIHWRSILDRELASEVSNKRISTGTTDDGELPNKRIAVEATDDDTRVSSSIPRGGQIPIPRGSISEREGVNLTGVKTELTPVKTPHTPKETPENVFDININKKRFPECPGGGQNLNPVRPPGFWAAWDAAIESRDLSRADHVHELHGVAISLGIVRTDDPLARGRIFAQAALNERLWRMKKTKTRKGLFASNVNANRWWCSNADDDAGRQMQRRAEKLVRCVDPASEKDRQRALMAEAKAEGRFATAGSRD